MGPVFEPRFLGNFPTARCMCLDSGFRLLVAGMLGFERPRSLKLEGFGAKDSSLDRRLYPETLADYNYNELK